MNKLGYTNSYILSPDVLMYVLPIFAIFFILLFRRQIIRRLFAFDEMGEKILAEKKSSEVRIGHIVEAISPFLKDFPADAKKDGTSLAYIGRPVDFVHFDPNEGVTFIEVKSGNAKLSPEQRKIKSLINQGKVAWAEYRVK